MDSPMIERLNICQDSITKSVQLLIQLQAEFGRFMKVYDDLRGRGSEKIEGYNEDFSFFSDLVLRGYTAKRKGDDFCFCNPDCDGAVDAIVLLKSHLVKLSLFIAEVHRSEWFDEFEPR